jgi:hypothetical protein
MGKNVGSKARPKREKVSNTPEKGVFRFRVVEHISWDAYDEKKECFHAGHKDNKPLAGIKFKIKMPDGSIISKITDKNGVIELTGQNPTAKYEIIFSPDSAELNDKHRLFYNRTTPVKKRLWRFIPKT